MIMMQKWYCAYSMKSILYEKQNMQYAFHTINKLGDDSMQATKQLNLRLPEELVFWIKNMAKKRHQSMNSYVLTELERIKKEYRNDLN